MVVDRASLARIKDHTGWSFGRMAEIAGVRKNTVIDWIKGDRPIPVDREGSLLAAMRREITFAHLSSEETARRLAEYEKVVTG
jgi:hypothetical protein